jgi:recombination protein RecA
MYNYAEFRERPEEEVDAVLAAVKKNCDNADIYIGKTGEQKQHPAISTGSIKLDRALGIGGYAVGKQIEIWGPESSGKTTCALHAITECQKAGGTCVFVDAEHALDTDYAEALGIDLDKLILHQPDHAEMALSIIDQFATSGIVDLIVIDSIAALVPKKELEGDMGDSNPGLMARLMSQALRKITGACAKNDVTVIWINQIRHKIGVMFGSPEVTTGGNALKFYASQRLDIRRTGSTKEDGIPVANTTKVTVKKNKLYPPYRVAEFEIKFGIGIDNMLELVDIAIEYEIIRKSGSWFSYGSERLAQGKANTVNRLRREPQLFDKLKTAVMHAMSPDNEVAEEDNHEPAPKEVKAKTPQTAVPSAVPGT